MRPVRQINESIINVQTRLRKKTQGAHREGYQFFPVAVAVSDRSYVQLLRYQSESHVHSMMSETAGQPDPQTEKHEIIQSETL